MSEAESPRNVPTAATELSGSFTLAVQASETYIYYVLVRTEGRGGYRMSQISKYTFGGQRRKRVKQSKTFVPSYKEGPFSGRSSELSYVLACQKGSNRSIKLSQIN